MAIPIENKRIESKPLTPKTRSERVEERLTQGRIRLESLDTHQLAAYRAYSAKVSEDIDAIHQAAPGSVDESWDEGKVLDKIRGGARRNFEQMTAAEKSTFVRLLNNYPGARNGQLPADLLNLLEEGKLTETDSKGGKLLDTLGKLSTQELAPGLNRGQILSELVERIAHPDRIRQGKKGTCTVTSLEHTLATRKPAEFARLVTGLVSEDGDVELADGSTLGRDGGCLEEDGSGRCSVDRIFQASMMEYCNGTFSNYDNANDRNEFIGVVSTGSGLPGVDLEDGLDAVYDRDFQTRSYEDSEEKRPELIQKFQRALRDGHPLLVGINWNPDPDGDYEGHKLEVTGISNGQVQLWNPWGPGEQGQGGPPRQLNERQGPGHITMTVDDFFSRLANYHLPSGY